MAIISTIDNVLFGGGSGGGGSDTFSINVGTINQNTGTMPTTRPDGTELKEGDWVAVDAGAIVPFNISYTKSGTQEVITVTNLGLCYYYNVSTTSWYQNAGSVIESSEVVVTNSTNETLDGTGKKQSNANQQVVTAIKDLQNNEVNGIDISKNENEYTFSLKHDNTTIDNATITIDSGIAEVATDDVVVDNPATESISGTATTQNVVNSEVKTKINGLASEEMTLTNKTISANDNNSVTHLKPQYCFNSNYYLRHLAVLDTNYYCFKSDDGEKVYTKTLISSENQIDGYMINENHNYYTPSRITDAIFYLDNFYPTNSVMLRGIKNGVTTKYYRYQCYDYVGKSDGMVSEDLTLPSSAFSLETSYKSRNQCLNEINDTINGTIIDNINFYCWVSDDVIDPEYVFTEKLNTGSAVAYTAQFIDDDISKDIINSAVINKEASIDNHLILTIITKEGGTTTTTSFTRAENYDKKYVHKGKQKVINAQKTLSLLNDAQSLSVDGTSIVSNNNVMSVGTITTANISTSGASAGDILVVNNNNELEYRQLGKITLYEHRYKAVWHDNVTYPNVYFVFSITTSSPDHLTYSELIDYLDSNGYTSKEKPYAVNGIFDTYLRYMANSQNGANDKLNTICYIAVGIFHVQGEDYIRILYNYGASDYVYDTDSTVGRSIYHLKTDEIINCDAILIQNQKILVSDILTTGGLEGQVPMIRNNQVRFADVKKVYKINAVNNTAKPETDLNYITKQLSSSEYRYYTPYSSSVVPASSFYDMLRTETDASVVELSINYSNNQSITAKLEMQYLDNNVLMPVFSGIHNFYATRSDGTHWSLVPFKISYSNNVFVYEPGMDLNNYKVLREKIEDVKHFKIKYTLNTTDRVASLLGNAIIFNNSSWAYLDSDNNTLSLIQLLSAMDSSLSNVIEICDSQGGSVLTRYSFQYSGSEHKEYFGLRRDGSNMFIGYLFSQDGSFQWTGFKQI